MYTITRFTIYFIILCYFNYVGTKRMKAQKKYNETKPSSKYDNPNFIRDRYKDEIWKPIMNRTRDLPALITSCKLITTKCWNNLPPPFKYLDEIWKPIMPESWVNRFKKPYHPAWMDYCDPYHCNDYHKVACGLNRRTMRFKWFQSVCHIILNNMCSQYRGALKYDVVDTKYCSRYVMFLRLGCPTVCPDKLDPICVIGSDNQVALFMNKCVLQRANCRAYPEKFRPVDMEICESLLETLF